MPSFRLFHTFISLLFTLLLAINHSLADHPPYGPEDADAYANATYGIMPEAKYRSTRLIGPHFLRRVWDEEKCKSDEHYFFAPRGMLTAHPGPMIVDNDGNLIWHSNAWPVAYGFTVQTYRDEDYLTFWSGNDQVIGHGSGYYFMLDKNYRQFKMIGAGSNLTGDLHEFKITKDNTALVTAYRPIPWDLSKFGRKGVSWIWDCYFQEIDIETNELMFEWKATDYFTFDDCFNELRNAGAPNNPWDWFHINSVAKDKHGNYLISSRYSHALTYIHGRSGRPMWHLGGKNNTFKDTTDGKAISFAWQHDARWTHDKDLEQISLFDNAAYFANQTQPARGLVLDINVNMREVSMKQSAIHPRKYISESQGSMQILAGERMLVGYGSAAAFSEFSKEGELECDVEFGALHFHEDGSFSPGAVMSYRTYKHAWVGHPLTVPDVAFDKGRFYVSWNGATEVRSWVLEGSKGVGGRESDWVRIIGFRRTGFESDTELDETAWKAYRLTALNDRGKTLGVWLVYSGGEVTKIPLPTSERLNAIVYLIIGALLSLLFNYLSSRFRPSSATSRARARSRSNSSRHPDYNSDSDEMDVLDHAPYRNGLGMGIGMGANGGGPTLNGKDAHEAEKLLDRRQYS